MSKNFLQKKEWFLSTELIKLDTLPNTNAGICVRAKKENWKTRKASGRGRALEYHISNFSDDVALQLQLREKTIETSDFEMSDFNSEDYTILRNESKDFSNFVKVLNANKEIVFVVDQSWSDEHILFVLRFAHRTYKTGVEHGRSSKANEIISTIKSMPM